MYRRLANGLFLKHFVREDYPSLLELDLHSGECLWDLRDFKQILGKQANGGCYLLVRQLGDHEKPLSMLNEEFVGFIVYESNRDHFHLLNMVVHHDHRRKGYGSVLLHHMKQKMRGKFEYLKSDLRETNLAGHLFLKENSFWAKGVERGYFQDHYPDKPVEYSDGYLFEYRKDYDNANTWSPDPVGESHGTGSRKTHQA